MRRAQSAIIKNPYIEKDRDWKPKKSKDADVGSYEVLKAVTFVKTRHPIQTIPRSKSLKFTVEFSNSKKFVPGAGHYKPMPCYDKIYRPMKMRF